MVAGNPQGLARAERELGLASWSVALRQSRFEYVADEVLCPSGTGPLACQAKRWSLLWRALRSFDLVHFNFGQSIMPQRIPQRSALDASRGSWGTRAFRRAYNCYAGTLELRDLAVLKWAGKGIVVTYQGDDARQGDFCLSHFVTSPAGDVDALYYQPETDAQKRSRIQKFGIYADRIYALNPDLLHVLPRGSEFLPYAHIDLRDWRPHESSRASAKPIVLHAPSHQGVKGTRFVREAVERLEKEGVALEFVLVEGIPHHEARRLYERADLVIDQLLCGWYGGFAVEAMALGKPVICYIREGDLGFIPVRMRDELPIINASPETVYSVLKQWLTERRGELGDVGQQGRAYVEAWHDPLKIAARLKQDYEAIMASKRKGRAWCAGF